MAPGARELGSRVGVPIFFSPPFALSWLVGGGNPKNPPDNFESPHARFEDERARAQRRSARWPHVGPGLGTKKRGVAHRVVGIFVFSWRVSLWVCVDLGVSRRRTSHQDRAGVGRACCVRAWFGSGNGVVGRVGQTGARAGEREPLFLGSELWCAADKREAPKTC